MYFRTKRNAVFERDFENIADIPELRHLSHIDLTENDMEFISLKRGKNNSRIYTPDPRLGDYET